MYAVAWDQQLVQDHKKFWYVTAVSIYIFVLSGLFFNKIPFCFNFYHSLNGLLINLSICGEMGLLTGKHIFKLSLETQSHFHFFSGYNPLGEKVST